MASWLGFGNKGSKPKKPSSKSKKKGGGFMSNVLRHKTFGKAKETPDDEFMLVRRRRRFSQDPTHSALHTQALAGFQKTEQVCCFLFFHIFLVFTIIKLFIYFWFSQ